ncbi:hypothetical protein [Thalassobacillus sp. C254]|uniref:hypothetical protein n=1 Tax=Thalassobacillus sp. C254 TaxID=1225341 RepID=UPI0006D08DB2|nr:hypothetical protein [Thalassobacillus sp. C254]
MKNGADNISIKQPSIMHADSKHLMAIYNINNTVKILPDNNGICLGSVFEEGPWHEPGSHIPDGTYAMVRSNNKYIEAVSDVVASRTIWYYMDEEKCIVSTSQRAIIMLLGNFELNENVIPWMLSAGNLGPGLSWDKRIKCVPPCSILRLNRTEWKIDIETQKVEFKSL